MKSLLILFLISTLCGGIFAITTSAETNIFAITEQTLPVILSSFSATTSVYGYVDLRWVTESETETLGFRVYRSEQDNPDTAILITVPFIPATNTSNSHTYTFTDRAVKTEHTYYYWLEIIELNFSSYHGPVNISLLGSESPTLPGQTYLSGIYPNPFRYGAQAQFKVDVKDSDHASLVIYNIVGQRVKSYHLLSGSHQLYWDGNDQRGIACGSGIYLLKLSTDTMN